MACFIPGKLKNQMSLAKKSKVLYPDLSVSVIHSSLFHGHIGIRPNGFFAKTTTTSFSMNKCNNGIVQTFKFEVQFYFFLFRLYAHHSNKIPQLSGSPRNKKNQHPYFLINLPFSFHHSTCILH